MITDNLNLQQPRKPFRLAQELIWLLGSIVTGLLVLPAMIYMVGVKMFDSYKGTGTATGITAFYADYAHDLATAHLSSWTVAIGPLLLIYILRLILGLPASNFSRLWSGFAKREASSHTD